MAEKYVGTIPHKTNDLTLNETSTVIYTVGGVDITTNLSPSTGRSYFPPKFSDFTTLETVGEIPLKNSLFNPNKSLNLSIDKRNARYFAKYGSLLELVRVSIENIILKYPAAIHSKTTLLGNSGLNILNAGYSFVDDITTFSANTSYFSNPFGIYYQNKLEFKFSDERIAILRNLTKNFNKYEVIIDGIAYPILEFTPSERSSNDIVKIKIHGEPLDQGNSSKEFYIKPIESEIVKFYESLDEFEEHLLNRDLDYEALFNAKREVDSGLILEYVLSLKFPKIDNYNLDISGRNYEIYLSELLEYAKNFDEKEGNILMRKFVPDSVQSVTLEDVNSAYPTYGEINRLLIVYGREFDKLNLYTEGVRYLNSVTYSGYDSVPEALLPEYIKTLGWDLDANPPIPNNLLKLLGLNSSWVFKSKGTRNAIEFILNFFGIPRSIVDFNEYVIRAKKPVDVEKLKFYYSLLSPDADFDITTLPIDENGYPVFIKDNDQDYFQRYGELDRGYSYFYKYFNLFPNGFTGSTVTYNEETNNYKVLFEQDFNGTGSTLSYSVVNETLLSGGCFQVSGETITDPLPEIFLDDCGCPLPISDNVVKICVEPYVFTGCTNIILDLWYQCSPTGDTAELNIDVYGGIPPYEIFGATDGQIVPTGETYSIYAVDSNGCSSDVYEIYIDCPDPCLDNDLDIDLSYTCNIDEFGRNDETATLSLSFVGTNITAVNDGDLVNHDNTVSVTVTNEIGCTLTKYIYINCPEPEENPCLEDISITASLETTSVNLEECTGKVNVVYDLDPVPFGYIIDEVILEVEVDGYPANEFIGGGPVITTFNSLTGVKTIDLDFSLLCSAFSSIPTSIPLIITVHATFLDGCEYERQFNLAVNPRQLGDYDDDTYLVSPLP
jgi:hypothetical protein